VLSLHGLLLLLFCFLLLAKFFMLLRTGTSTSGENRVRTIKVFYSRSFRSQAFLSLHVASPVTRVHMLAGRLAFVLHASA
jgi:hypothetical protein